MLGGSEMATLEAVYETMNKTVAVTGECLQRTRGNRLLVSVGSEVLIAGSKCVVNDSGAKWQVTCELAAPLDPGSYKTCVYRKGTAADGNACATMTVGAQGAVGSEGKKGKPGSVGAKGATGAKGETGDKGDPGIKGDVGSPGTDGATGSRGTDGADGEQGEPGEKGEKGGDGPGGASVVCDELANCFIPGSNFGGNTTGQANTASGSLALDGNTTGLNNTAIGVKALQNNVDGDQNSASGVQALMSNTSGFSNTASGVSALAANETGSYNTATGAFALLNNTVGNDNTAVGVAALQNNNGSSNIALGRNAGLNLSFGSDNIMIGNAGVDGDSNTIRLGTSGTHTETRLVGDVKIEGASVFGAISKLARGWMLSCATVSIVPAISFSATECLRGGGLTFSCQDVLSLAELSEGSVGCDTNSFFSPISEEFNTRDVSEKDCSCSTE
jgi:hypothetical protein